MVVLDLNFFTNLKGKVSRMEENTRPKRRRTTRIDRVRTEEKMDHTDSIYTINYQQNAASANAKFLCEFREFWVHEFWIDKHYSNRKDFGDHLGPRDGIEEHFIEELVKKSIPHLFYYSLKHAFKFINFPPKTGLPQRLVLQEVSNTSDTLNTVVEFHFLDTNKYEVTVRTAMCVENFKIQDNQYVVQFAEDESNLLVFKNKQFVQLDQYVS